MTRKGCPPDQAKRAGNERSSSPKAAYSNEQWLRRHENVQRTFAVQAGEPKGELGEDAVPTCLRGD